MLTLLASVAPAGAAGDCEAALATLSKRQAGREKPTLRPGTYVISRETVGNTLPMGGSGGPTPDDRQVAVLLRYLSRDRFEVRERADPSQWETLADQGYVPADPTERWIAVLPLEFQRYERGVRAMVVDRFPDTAERDASPTAPVMTGHLIPFEGLIARPFTAGGVTPLCSVESDGSLVLRRSSRSRGSERLLAVWVTCDPAQDFRICRTISLMFRNQQVIKDQATVRVIAREYRDPVTISEDTVLHRAIEETQFAYRKLPGGIEGALGEAFDRGEAAEMDRLLGEVLALRADAVSTTTVRLLDYDPTPIPPGEIGVRRHPLAATPAPTDFPDS